MKITALILVCIVTLSGNVLSGCDLNNILNSQPVVETISFEKKEIVLGVGQEYNFDVAITPKDAKAEYQFSSSDTEVLSLDGSKGKAVLEGECTVTVTTDNDLVESCRVRVAPAPKKVALPKNVKLAVGEEYDFKPKGDFTEKVYTYKSGDKGVAPIDKDGRASALKPGNSTITVTSYNGVSANCEITACEAPKEFILNGGSTNIGRFDKVPLYCEFADGEGALDLNFTSSDENIVTVDNEGMITGVNSGEAVVTCTLFNGVSADCTITVNEYEGFQNIRLDLDPAKPMVALTFDDGPNGECTKSILDTLEKYNAKATFFIVGNRVAGQEDMLKAEYDAGHEIGNHSWDHQYANNISEAEQLQQITRSNEAIYNAIGKYPTLFRCPGGISCDTYEVHSNMPIIMWSIDTVDWQTRDSKATYKAITDVFKKGQNVDGDIILMHDIQSSTPKAVKNICKYLDEKGYQMVTVSELAYYRDCEMENGGYYSSFYQ